MYSCTFKQEIQNTAKGSKEGEKREAKKPTQRVDFVTKADT